MYSTGRLIGILCCVVAAGLYIWGLSCDSTVESLKDVTRVDKLKDLAALLNAREELPLLVEVFGKVGSETPIDCEYTSVKGVIVEKEQRSHFMKRNDEDEWEADSTRLSFKSTTVPWYLDDSTGRVNVPRTHGALCWDKMVRNGVFEKSERFRDSAEVEERGLEVLGIKKIERVLPIGTPLTVIGEAVEDQTDGTIQIRKPHKGPFYLSDKTVPQIIGDNQRDSSVCKYVAMGLAVCGVYLLAESVYRDIRHRICRREMRRSRTSSAGGIKWCTGEWIGMTDQGLCLICFERDYNSVFVPCGHMGFCVTCALDLNLCPVCRAPINQVVRTFRP